MKTWKPVSPYFAGLTRSLCLALLLGFSLGSCGTPKTPVKVANPAALPFGFTSPTDLEKVSIRLAFLSAKTGAGQQEITLSGTGHVRLYFSRSAQDKRPKVKEADCGPGRILRLLDFLEGMGSLERIKEDSENDQGGSLRILEVTLPDGIKTLKLPASAPADLEQLFGATLLVAGQCLPEALNNRFFPNL